LSNLKFTFELPVEATKEICVATRPTVVKSVVTLYVFVLLKVYVLAAVTVVCARLATVKPAVPKTEAAAFGNVNVPSSTNALVLIVKVAAAVKIKLCNKVFPEPTIVQEDAIDKTEVPTVTVPDVCVSVGVPLAAYKFV